MNFELYEGQEKIPAACQHWAYLSQSLPPLVLAFLLVPTVVQAQVSVSRPKIATVKSMTNGDIMCYVRH